MKGISTNLNASSDSSNPKIYIATYSGQLTWHNPKEPLEMSISTFSGQQQEFREKGRQRDQDEPLKCKHL